MKKLASAVVLAAASLLAAPAFAQAGGEADAAQSKAAPGKPVTALQKEGGRLNRKANGKTVARAGSAADDAPASTGTAGVPKKERRAAAAQRKGAAAAAVKKGEIGSGEK